MESIGHFAAGVFWKAGAHEWQDRDQIIPQLSFGPYEEMLRTYLLGQNPLPESVAITATLSDNSNRLIDAISFPFGSRTFNGSSRSYHMYRFDILGICFRLYIGRRIPDLARQRSLLNKSEKFVLVDRKMEADVLEVGRPLWGSVARLEV